MPPYRFMPSVRSKARPQGELQLPRWVGTGGLHGARRQAVISREVIESNLVSDAYESRCVALVAVLGELHQLVIAVEGVEGFDDQVHFPAVVHEETPGDPHIGR